MFDVYVNSINSVNCLCNITNQINTKTMGAQNLTKSTYTKKN